MGKHNEWLANTDLEGGIHGLIKYTNLTFILKNLGVIQISSVWIASILPSLKPGSSGILLINTKFLSYKYLQAIYM
jgi:hypothetical protein